jgi:hypothetical protein
MQKEVFDQLAASGRYYNTGKVLIGLQHATRPRKLNRDEEQVQALLLRAPTHTPTKR